MGKMSENKTKTEETTPQMSLPSALDFPSKRDHVKHILAKWSADAAYQRYSKPKM